MQIDGRLVIAALVVVVVLAVALYHTYARTEKKLDQIVGMLGGTVAPAQASTPVSMQAKTKPATKAQGDFDL